MEVSRLTAISTGPWYLCIIDLFPCVTRPEEDKQNKQKQHKLASITLVDFLIPILPTWGRKRHHRDHYFTVVSPIMDYPSPAPENEQQPWTTQRGQADEPGKREALSARVEKG